MPEQNTPPGGGGFDSECSAITASLWRDIHALPPKIRGEVVQRIFNRHWGAPKTAVERAKPHDHRSDKMSEFPNLSDGDGFGVACRSAAAIVWREVQHLPAGARTEVLRQVSAMSEHHADYALLASHDQPRPATAGQPVASRENG